MMIAETLERQDRAKGLARVFKALGDENRLAIFQLLRERCAGGCEVSEDGADRTVTEIAKDFDLALKTGRGNNSPMPITSLARQFFGAMMATGKGDLDFFGYVTMMEEIAGIKK